jgi:hypothetical protein
MGRLEEAPSQKEYGPLRKREEGVRELPKLSHLDDQGTKDIPP